MQGNIPNVAVYDLAVQKRENDLVIGSHGRSIYIMDLNPIYEVLRNQGQVIKILSASEIRFNPRWAAWSEGIITKPTQNILFYSNSDVNIKIEVLNTKGESLKSWDVLAIKGYNSTYWQHENLGRGKYQINITSANNSDKIDFEVK